MYDSWEKGFRQYLIFERALSSNTIDAYLKDVAKFSSFAQSIEKPFSAIALKDLEQFIIELTEIGLGSRSQARIMSGVKAFFQYLLIEKEVENNPASFWESPKIGKKLPEVLEAFEMDSMIEAIDHTKSSGQRDRAIIEVLYSTGLRVSELTHLLLGDLFLSENYIRVTGKGNKQRLVPIGSVAIKHLQYYINHERDKLKPKGQNENIVFLNQRAGKLSRVSVFTLVKELSKKAGINKNVSPHTIRHTFATVLLEAGADLRAIQQMLGHQSITTTEIYTHIDRSYLKDVIKQFHPRS
jgi:integrase/recombinase XerD